MGQYVGGSSWVSGCWRRSRGVRPSDPCPIADHVFLRRLLVAVMAGIVPQPVPTMASLQMINLTSLIAQGSPHFYLRMSPANRFDYSRQQMPSHELSQPPDSHPINAITG